MAQLGAAFNPQDHDTEQKEFSLLPEMIAELEVESSKANEKNNDSYFRLDVVYSVRAPEEFEGRKIFDGFNLVHSNAQAAEISNRQFASLCRAIGHTGALADSEDLHLKPFVAKIKVKGASKGKDGKEYGPKNEIARFYFPDEGDLPEVQVLAATNDNARPAANDNRAAPAAAAPAKKPWGSKR